MFSPYEEELQVRANRGFAVGTSSLGTVANPQNWVLFNPVASGKDAMLRRFWFSGATAGDTVGIFGLTADPAFALSLVPKPRKIGGGVAVVLFELAIAATPANSGQLHFFAAEGTIINKPVECKIWFPAGTGILFQWPALGNTRYMNFQWEEQ